MHFCRLVCTPEEDDNHVDVDDPEDNDEDDNVDGSYRHNWSRGMARG